MPNYKPWGQVMWKFGPRTQTFNPTTIKHLYRDVNGSIVAGALSDQATRGVYQCPAGKKFVMIGASFESYANGGIIRIYRSTTSGGTTTVIYAIRLSNSVGPPQNLNYHTIDFDAETTDNDEDFVSMKQTTTSMNHFNIYGYEVET